MEKNTCLYFLLLILMVQIACQPQGAVDEVVPSGLLLPESALPDYEKNVDHATLLERLDEKQSIARGEEIYGAICFNCHGNPDQPGSLPTAHTFWSGTFKHGSDPYKMYQTLTHGYGLMPAQIQLVPQQKYEVIHFIREAFIKEQNPNQYFEVDADYIARLPKGDTLGPEPHEFKPWAEMDYGDFLMYTYEIVDKDAPPRAISGGPSPLPNEDFSEANFAQKGIAVRLDEGKGGVAAGNAFMVFDHDLMRVAGAWTGEGFIDWRAILFNGEHNIYPRTVGDLQFELPVGPGWAHPKTGSFKDPRFLGLDGRPFGPLPKEWTHYKGVYHYENKAILKYTIGDAVIHELFGLESHKETPIFTRTLNIQPGTGKLLMRVAPTSISVSLKGNGGVLKQSAGFHMLEIAGDQPVELKILISKLNAKTLTAYAQTSAEPGNLSKYLKGGPAHYKEVLTSPITAGEETMAYAVDVLQLPQNSPWKNRFMLGGIDFIPDTDQALVCTVGGDVWKIEGITQKTGSLKWTRIASGLFQPLGIKMHNGAIYVSCRNQIAVLRDLNGDGATDFYESFNNDHQVTEHFHEFAMGLQVDKAGNFYYAKSARHARTPLVPHHGTLLKVSPDGEQTEIVAKGFRAANGVCINPDGSFIVTDQEGHWNPMNRINWVTPGNFYGNMYGYGAPKDSSDAAMVQPLCWVDMKYDRSPSELLWVDSDQWGPLKGSLLNFSYGYGKVYVVPHERVNGTLQGGLIEIPIPQFATGVMRGRFHPEDGQLYACGLSAWATNQVIQEGALYRVRYTGKAANLPVELNALENGLNITFTNPLDPVAVTDESNFKVNTYALKRTRNYGSKRYGNKELDIKESKLSADGQSILLEITGMKKEWIMEVSYDLKSVDGVEVKGTIQNTIHVLGKEELVDYQ